MKSNLLKKHAKSFYWASFFLPNNTLNKCSSLYNFCRTLDDIVDNNNNLNAKKEIFSKFKKDFENKNFNNQKGKESNNSKLFEARVMVLVHETSSAHTEQVYEVLFQLNFQYSG